MHRLWKTAFTRSNNPGKQTVQGLKCHLEKCHTVYEESGIPSTRTTCRKAKLDEILAAHCRADLVTECMKRRNTLILPGDCRFRFSAENECLFSFSFRFRTEMEFHFRRHFRLRPKMTNAFRSASSISQKGLGLGLVKSLDYITTFFDIEYLRSDMR